MTRKWTLSYYLIAFLDVLGQSQEVLRLSRLPSNPEEEAFAKEILASTAGYIMDLRQSFLGFFDALAKPTGLLDKLPPEKRERANRMRRCKAEVRGLSDSIVITVPLSNEDDHSTSMTGIYAALFAVCGIFVAALAQREPFRGGVDIGWGVRLTEQEVYGSALVKAVSLESSVAQYPRVVIGNSLWGYLTEVKKLVSDTVFGKWARKTAADCKTLATEDYDSCRILDVIGGGAHSVADGIKPEWVGDGYKFVVDTHERFGKEGNMKLHARYGWLRSYFESRLHLWGIPPVQPGA
jgi:hypothetical protein